MKERVSLRTTELLESGSGVALSADVSARLKDLTLAEAVQ
jgi:hypothetical protein